MEDWFILSSFCPILFDKLFTTDALCLKNAPKMSTFLMHAFMFNPYVPSLVKLKIIKKLKPLCTTTISLVLEFNDYFTFNLELIPSLETKKKNASAKLQSRRKHL